MLRLQTALEYRLRDLAQDAPVARASRRWIKEGKRLRRVLGPVRDVDVYLEKLESLREALAAPSGLKIQDSQRCLREIDELKSSLKHLRQSRVKKIRSEIEDHREGLRDLDLEIGGEPRIPKSFTAESALQNFAEVAVKFQTLNGDNLHAYRKGLKKTRYLAEISAPADPQVQRLAATFKKMQDAIGNWHDWQELGKNAESTFSESSGGVAPLLGEQTEKALQAALSLCRRSKARLLESGADEGSAALNP
jgi:CHAD domain-containing protein